MNISRINAIDAKMTAAIVEVVGADLASNEERIAKTASAVKASTMEKTAGIMIDNPTLENCEDFVRRYMHTELALLPQLMEFSVNIIPSKYDSTNEAFLTDGTGMVRVKVHSKTIEIPFLIYNGELVPFDIIQMDGQRVPYSRENLIKIISGVKYKEEQVAQTNGGESPYVELADHYNTATVPGFMGEALSIRDTHSHRTGAGSMYVTAGDYEYGIEKEAKEESAITEKSRPHGDLLGMGLFSDKRRKSKKKKDEKTDKEEKQAAIITDLDAILEKVAGINAMTDEQYQAIADALNKKAHQEYKENLEKMASEMPDLEMTRMEKRAMEEKLTGKFHTLSSFGNGEFILFPEIVNKAISLTPAVVFKTSKGKMVLTNDRRFEVVKDPSKFICKKAPTEFKIKMSSVDKLNNNDNFILLVGDKAEPVKTVTVTRNYKKGKDLFDAEANKDAVNSITTFVHYKDEGARDSDRGAGRGKFCIMETSVPVTTTKEECLTLLAKHNAMPENEVRAVVREFESWCDAPITVVSPKTPIIVVGDKITTRVESNKQYEELMKMASAGYEIELGTEKLAFSLNTVTVKCLNPRNKIFNLEIDYKDTSERMLNKRRQEFKGISIGKLKAILYMLKFEGNIINEIIYKAKNEPQAQYPLPVGCTQDDINAVFGGNQVNVSKQAIKDNVAKFVDPYTLAKGVATAAGASLIATSAANQIRKGGVSGKVIADALNFVSRVAMQSEELCASYEKIAIEKESVIHQDYAKAFAIGNIFCEKVAHAIKDQGNAYPSIKDASECILASKPVLEKFAYEITKEKVNSLRNGNTENMTVLCSSADVLDKIYKVAYELDKAIDFSDMKFM